MIFACPYMGIWSPEWPYIGLRKAVISRLLTEFSSQFLFANIFDVEHVYKHKITLPLRDFVVTGNYKIQKSSFIFIQNHYFNFNQHDVVQLIRYLIWNLSFLIEKWNPFEFKSPKNLHGAYKKPMVLVKISMKSPENFIYWQNSRGNATGEVFRGSICT